MSLKLAAGIDEAGYGPLLGPMTATVVIFEGEAISEDRPIETLLSSAISKNARLEDSRLRVDDSKRVFQGSSGGAHLEKTSLAMWLAARGSFPEDLGAWIDGSALRPGPILECCPWYGSEPRSLPLPKLIPRELAEKSGLRLRRALEGAGIVRCAFLQQVVTEPELNREVALYGLKSEVLFHRMGRLILEAARMAGDKPLYLDVDKLGGRDYYTNQLFSLFPMAKIVVEKEGRDESRYRVETSVHHLRIRFLKQGDSRCAAIALASILSKYVRELFMHLFNRYWERRIPSLRPTAGYPEDGARFLAEISAAAQIAGIDFQAMRRCR